VNGQVTEPPSNQRRKISQVDPGDARHSLSAPVRFGKSIGREGAVRRSWMKIRSALGCQNNHKNSKGNGTWVGCKFNWPKNRCYTMKTGHGQADWYVTSHDSGLKCI
jgi:hypothetical protein